MKLPFSNLKSRLILIAGGLSLATVVACQGPRVGTKAPEFIGNDWLNAPKPLHLGSLRGKVLLVQFWTLGCINCKHNLPAYNAWAKEFKGAEFQIVGIHTPETAYEKDQRHIREAIDERHIEYPVLVDTAGRNWNAWNQEYWPAIYLVDRNGVVRDSWQGELGDQGGPKLTREIKMLLAEK
jgi:peroxiredoxin